MRAERQAHTIAQVGATENWEVWLVELGQFPVDRLLRAPVCQWTDAFTSRVCGAEKLTLEYFVQFTQLHHEDGPQRLSQNGKAWMPQLGLGIWPDREPPSLWTVEEFQNLAPGEMIRPLMHQVFRVTTDAESRHAARGVMFGIGAGMQVLVPEGDTEFTRRTTELLLPRIQEPSFRAFEFYVPLLDRNSVASADAATLDEWMSGARLYWRESPEDGGLLVLSAIPLAGLWPGLGFDRLPGQPAWRLPF